jgi:hypothetical protein
MIDVRMQCQREPLLLKENVNFRWIFLPLVYSVPIPSLTRRSSKLSRLMMR